MNTENQEIESLSPESIAMFKSVAEEKLSELSKLAQEEAGIPADLKRAAVNLYPFSGKFSVSGAIALSVASAPIMDFTKGVKLRFNGTGFGAALGGGVYIGGGSFSVDPATLIGQKADFAVGPSIAPAIPGALMITWTINGRPVGTFIGPGLAIFGGGGTGSGAFRQG